MTDLDARLDNYMRLFVGLDEEFIRHTSPPMDINAAMRAAAQFQLHGALRDSVRGMLVASSDVLGSLRNQLDFRRSFVLSLVALMVAILSLFAAVGALYKQA